MRNPSAQPQNFGQDQVSAADIALSDSFDAFRRLKTAVWVFDIDHSRVVQANDAALEIWQAETEGDLCGRDLSVGMSTTVHDRLRQYQRDFTDHDSTFNEMWTIYPNGVPVTLMVIYSGYLLPDGRMAMMCEVPGTAEDTPENIRSAEALLHTDVMITLYGEAGDVLYMNPMARRTVRTGPQCFRASFVNPEDHDDILHQVIERGEVRQVTRMKTNTGKSWHDLSVKRCTDAATGEPAILVTAVDVSELKTARDKARYLADCDQLTGCHNRAYLTRQLEKKIHANQRQDFALIFFDLDRFKHINDSFGHEVGDIVLCETTRRLQECLGEGDVLSRFGGDEFVALLASVQVEDDLEPRLKSIRAAINKPVEVGTTRLAISSSMGVALIPAGETDWSEYMKRADIALYFSKQTGRDRFAIFSEEMRETALERYRLEQDLKLAIQEDQFELFYQPRVDVGSGRILSLEALVRWRHPERGLIFPDQFIPICEETGMIEELGNMILEKGCHQLIVWLDQGLDVGVSINVSPRQFLDPKFMRIIQRLSELPEFPIGKIELEITETVLAGDHEALAHRLEQITRLGFRLSVDDFGTGYSNLAYISRFPLDCIKIDKSFVDELPETEPIIRLIRTMADQIGASTVAEGVETQAQVERLLQLGCQQMQGYYFSPPKEVSEIVSELKQMEALRY